MHKKPKDRFVDKADKFNHYLTWFIRLALISSFILGLYNQRWMVVFVSSLTFLMSFLPQIVQRRYRINLPGEFQVIIVVFIYAGIYLGEVRAFYLRYWWWDSVLHAFSGIALGFTGFLILYSLYKTERLKANPFLIVVFSFFFAVGLGGVWEIFEFTMDSTFGMDMQKARDLEETFGSYDTRLGVIDTMYDLILDAFGALIASIGGYLYLKNGEVFLFNRLIRRFEERNIDIFKKRQ
ncbi:MAG: hypothetical protein ACLFTR_03325 [Candidatus Woesearchaeota archaeon]